MSAVALASVVVATTTEAGATAETAEEAEEEAKSEPAEVEP